VPTFTFMISTTTRTVTSKLSSEARESSDNVSSWSHHVICKRMPRTPMATPLR
jgi:hypothetical protein